MNFYQSDNDLLLIQNFHIHRARANVVSFFRSLLISLFGKVDPKLSVYIPDIERFVDKRTNHSVYKFADVQTSLVNIVKWWEEKKRKMPYVIISPGGMIENKVEFGGDNWHFGEVKRVFGSQANTNVTFLVGAEDDSSRTQLADILYTAMTQFYRKNFFFRDLDESGVYSLIIKNDSIKMSTDGVVDISQYEKIFTVGIQTEILLDWQFEMDMSLIAAIHQNTTELEYTPDPEPSQLYWVEMDGENLTEQDRVDINAIQTFIFLHLDELENKGDIIGTVATSTGVVGDDGSQFITLDNNNLVTIVAGGLLNHQTPVNGWSVMNLETEFTMLFTSNRWISDQWGLLGG